MGDTRVPYEAAIMTGDRVTTIRPTARGTVPSGSTGVVTSLESVPGILNRNDRIVVAKVHFPGLGEFTISTGNLSKTMGRFECPAPYDWQVTSSPRRNGKATAIREAQKHADLSAAHERVAKALDDLRKVEESYR